MIKVAFDLRENKILKLHENRTGKCFLICTAKTTDERKQWEKALRNVMIRVITTPKRAIKPQNGMN